MTAKNQILERFQLECGKLRNYVYDDKILLRSNDISDSFKVKTKSLPTHMEFGVPNSSINRTANPCRLWLTNNNTEWKIQPSGDKVTSCDRWVKTNLDRLRQKWAWPKFTCWDCEFSLTSLNFETDTDTFYLLSQNSILRGRLWSIDLRLSLQFRSSGLKGRDWDP